MVGTSLGPYKILDELGAGGMGEVYRGEDTRLGRNVAIKVLPAAFASDPERLARFEQEARAAAALNHPHIAVVHDVGSETDENGETTHFIVQEYLEGEPLGAAITTGALPVKKGLRIAIEVAEALAAAHAAGIVHRDLKPDNVFISPDGHAKVLDFGLAKLTEATAADGSNLSMSPTMMGTVAGQVMGTAGYMAPEQVSGEEVDARADVFGFGCVLYQMSTGRQPFAGKNLPEILHKIANVEPEPLAALDPAVPGELQRIVTKCLAKDPDDRYQHAEDLAVDLRTLRSGVVETPRVQHQVVGTSGGPMWRRVTELVAVAIVAALAAAWFATSDTSDTPEIVGAIFPIDPPDTSTLLQGASTGLLAVSPNGNLIVFEWGGSLWARRLDALDPSELAFTQGASRPFFSPDGTRVGFWGDDGRIHAVDLAGSAPVPIGEAERGSGAHWAEDGYIYFGALANGIRRIAANGTSGVESFVQLDAGRQAYGPQLLPGGAWMIFTLRDSALPWDEASIVAYPLEGGAPRELVRPARDGRYVPTGHLVYGYDNNLYARPFDLDSAQVTGEAVAVVSGVRNPGTTGGVFYAFSATGVLAYRPVREQQDSRSTLVWAEAGAPVVPLPIDARGSYALGLSPDEQTLALEQTEGDGNWRIWLHGVDGTREMLLTPDGNNEWPLWSHDGLSIYFKSDRDGNHDIWNKPVDESRDARKILDTDRDLRPISVSRDGSLLLFDSGGGTNRDIGIMRLDGSGEHTLLIDSADDEGRADISPNNRFITYESDQTGEIEVYVAELDHEDGFSITRTLPLSAGRPSGRSPRWSNDGTRVFYKSSMDDSFVSVAFDAERFTAAEPVEVARVRSGEGANFAVSVDDRLLITRWAGNRRSLGFVVDTGWFARLPERRP